MDPKARWEQEQLNELGRIAILEKQELVKDYFEQMDPINAFENWQEEEQQLRNNEELIQLEQWENIELLIRTLN
jgi:hypothetical protein